MEQSKILQMRAMFAPGEVTGKFLTECNPVKLGTEYNLSRKYPKQAVFRYEKGM